MRRPLLVGLCALQFFVLVRSRAGFRYGEHRRYKRQLGSGDILNQQIDLNITVPYIFSARLYPYGESKGDLLISGDTEPYRLANPFHYLGQDFFHPIEDLICTVFMLFYLHSVCVYSIALTRIASTSLSTAAVRLRLVLVRQRDDGMRELHGKDADGNVFQLALIIGDSMTFAHLVYSKLNSNDNAVAGFSTLNTSYSLPDSATHDALLLSEKSDIGIPGEWLFRVDESQDIQPEKLCFSCRFTYAVLASKDWNALIVVPRRNGSTTVPENEDECELDDVCPSAQPDCLNTPGSYLCICFEYDEENKRCKGSKSAQHLEEKIPVQIVPVQPSFGRTTAVTKPPARSTTTTSTTTTTSERPVTVKVAEFKPAKVKPSTPICPPCDIHATCRDGKCECHAGWKPYKNIKTPQQRSLARRISDQKPRPRTNNHKPVPIHPLKPCLYRCIDIDECAESSVCGTHSECINRPGSYDCTCDKGYRFVEGGCVGGSMISSDNVQKWIASWTNGVVKVGVASFPLVADVNECRESDVCSNLHGVECLNRPGSYECICKDGFEGDPKRGCSELLQDIVRLKKSWGGGG
ncbi:calcium binding EGF domain protein [Ancylostoma ceylanicum]|uniref:Calcium binding EGF domain protein n=1 Tax=Ancylostoma ceylanicum TaxID=53326 RepID=A0A0D6M9Z9_9BILA|nr:calcium binding EGF domain protein [Ancylostoma ceylanicum]